MAPIYVLPTHVKFAGRAVDFVVRVIQDLNQVLSVAADYDAATFKVRHRSSVHNAVMPSLTPLLHDLMIYLVLCSSSARLGLLLALFLEALYDLMSVFSVTPPKVM